MKVIFVLLAGFVFQSHSPLESDDLRYSTFSCFEGQTDRFDWYLPHFGSLGDLKTRLH